MASLLGWVGKKIKGGVQTLERDVIHPVENRVVNPVVHQAQAVVAQANPFDSGRTYNTVNQQGSSFAPKGAVPVLYQATHNGATNMAGSFVKPFVRTGIAVNQGVANLERKAAGVPTLNAQQFTRQTGIPHLQSFSGYTGTKGQVAADLANNAISVAAPGVGKVIEKSFASVAPKVIPRILPKIVANAGTGAVVGAPLSVTNLAASGQPVNAQSVKQAALQGAQAGALLGGGGTAAGEVVSKVAPAVARNLSQQLHALPDRVRSAQLASATKDTAVKPLPVNKLTSYEGAPDRARVDFYKQQIQSGNPVSPIIAIRDSSGKLGIEDGKHRYQAYKELGVKNVPTKVTTWEDIRRKNQGGYITLRRGDATSEAAQNVPRNTATSSLDSGTVQAPSGLASASVSLPESIAPPLQDVMTSEPPVPPVQTAAAAPPIIPPENRLTVASSEGPNQGVPAPLGPQRQSSFSAKTVPGSEFVSKDVKQKLNSPSYTVQQEKANYTASLGRAQQLGPGQFVDESVAALNKPNGHISRQEASNAITAAQLLDGSTNPADLERASQIYDRLSEHYTAAGQLTQSAAILSRRTPQGLLFDSRRQLQRAGADITPELQAELQTAVDRFAKAKGADKSLEAAKVAKLVADNTPQGSLDKLTSVWKAGLLSGVKTQQGNALSNATFGLLKKVSDVPAVVADKAFSLKTGERTKTLTGRGTLTGAKEGAVNAGGTLRTGLDKRNISEGKYQQHGELNFKNPIINKVFGKTTNLVFRSMSAADQPFYYSAAKNSLYDQATALAKTKGLKGTERNTFIKNTVKNPSTGMAERARTEADKAVLGYDTAGSKIIQGGLNALDRTDFSPAGKAFARHTLNVLAPFVKVPSAFISRTIDFTPAGPFKEAFRQISNKQFDQRALSQAIGEGLTGTGAVALGIALSKNGLISGDYPRNDPKEAQRWKAEGITPNSVKIGNDWYSLNYMGPLGLLFNAGHQYDLGHADGAANSIGAAVGGIGQGLLGQSFLQGLSGLSDAITNPEQNAKSYVNSQLSSAVPAWLNDLANVTDSSQRQADNPIQAAKNRVPGLRETNKIKQDVYGNPLNQAAGQLNTLNGIKPSRELAGSNPVLAEVDRLHKSDPNNKDLAVTPTAVDKTVTVEKKQVPLTDDQRYELQRKVGQATQSAWAKLIQTPAYKQLDDVSKAKALNNLRTDVNTLATRQFVTDSNLGTYSKSPSASVVNLGEGNTDLSTYATNASSQNTGSGVAINPKIDKSYQQILSNYNGMNSKQRTAKAQSDPAFEYSLLQAKYQNDKANGSITGIQDISRTKALQKSKVGSAYSKNVRDLYGMSKADITSYLNSQEPGVDKQQVAKQLIQYDQALKAAGLTTSLKFKTGIAPKSGSGGKKGGGSSNKNSAYLANLRYNTAIKAPTAPKTAKPGRVPKAKKTQLRQYAVTKSAIAPPKITVKRGIS